MISGSWTILKVGPLVFSINYSVDQLHLHRDRTSLYRSGSGDKFQELLHHFKLEVSYKTGKANML